MSIAAVMLAAGLLQPPANPQAVALQEFQTRVDAYVAQRAAEEEKLPPLTAGATAARIAAHSDALARALQQARRGVRQGNVFVPAAATQFRLLIRAELARRDVQDAQAVVSDAPEALRVRVNERYPRALGYGTVPARLLTMLQALPDGLEYRFLGRHLVLLDARSGLVVDYVPDVISSRLRH